MAAVGENTHVTDEDVAAFLRAKAASRTKQDAEIVVMFARYISSSKSQSINSGRPLEPSWKGNTYYIKSITSVPSNILERFNSSTLPAIRSSILHRGRVSKRTTKAEFFQIPYGREKLEALLTP